MDDERIVEEWLCVVRGNRETTLYERSTDAQGQVEIGELGFKDASPKLQALVQIGGPQNQTFLEKDTDGASNLSNCITNDALRSFLGYSAFHIVHMEWSWTLQKSERCSKRPAAKAVSLKTNYRESWE